MSYLAAVRQSESPAQQQKQRPGNLGVGVRPHQQRLQSGTVVWKERREGGMNGCSHELFMASGGMLALDANLHVGYRGPNYVGGRKPSAWPKYKARDNVQ